MLAHRWSSVRLADPARRSRVSGASGLWVVVSALLSFTWTTQVLAAQENTCARAGCHEDVETDKEHAPKLKCEDCHPNVKGDEHPDALSDFGPEQMCGQAGCHPDAQPKVLAGPHKDSGCDQCHGFVHDGSFEVTSLSNCRACHKDAVNQFGESIHGKEKVMCGQCHGDIHAAVSRKDPRAPMSKVMQIETCGSAECHDSKEVKAFRKSVHGRAVLLSGLDVAPTCQTCHGAHGIKKVKDPTSPVAQKNIPETCGSCHKFILAAFKESVHAEMLARGKKAPVCTNCHSTHGIVDLAFEANRLKMPEQCGECHESKHETYLDSFHGKATHLGLAVAATCSDCHTPHKMLKKDNPKSSVNSANLEKTCSNCHGKVTASFLQFKPHLNPANKDEDKTVHYIWLFMTVLLVGTLGFFSLHTLLWLQRTVVSFARGELKSHHGGDVWIRRFRPIHMWIHFTIILTFLALAFTGLPLKFSTQAWAAPLAHFAGGLGGTRYLHRAAGVLTFAYGFVFVFYLLREIVGKKRRALLWGWQSMVPHKKDLTDLIQNLRWFLYLGPRPRLDRWAYWEKFDFFAVFWGIPVIGLSGLVLWFPIAASTYLPGWALNIAYIIHSDEALLATGFIFFFHFFHTHLRPEAFPLDPVIFTGSVPLERFMEERPAEYERLVAAGELDDYKVPPPSERLQTMATAFGFLALTVGLILGVSLSYTGIHAVLKYMGLE